MSRRDPREFPDMPSARHRKERPHLVDIIADETGVSDTPDTPDGPQQPDKPDVSRQARRARHACKQEYQDSTHGGDREAGDLLVRRG